MRESVGHGIYIGGGTRAMVHNTIVSGSGKAGIAILAGSSKTIVSSSSVNFNTAAVRVLPSVYLI